ncbi:MAG TPA: AAA-like domain-containing protein [Nostocaceae cyanobacterium]|nr:AAA-like domain-containing protein [Nostocaceae cyanobacterium]
MKKILILSANPTNTSKLRLDEEVREIEAALERAKHRDKFTIITKWAVRPGDLRRALLDNEPEILHFSGHGAGNPGLVLEDNAGQKQLVSTDALANLFKSFKNIECIILNACYSEVQADAIHQYINNIVGMNQPIGDKDAIQFATGFYDALGAGKSYAEAFEIGKNAIELEGLTDAMIPVFKSRENQINQNGSFAKSGNIKLEPPEGQVPLDSAVYIQRPPGEKDAYHAILKPGALVRIKSPKEMGKTSLMARVLQHGRNQSYKTAIVNFKLFDAESFNNLDNLLKQFCAIITDNLDLQERLEEFWQKKFLPCKVKCTNYFQHYLLKESNTSLILGLDEVDEIFKYPVVAADFFALLRAWHEKSKNESLWQRLNLVIAYSQEVPKSLNTNSSPFNVGLEIKLTEFNQVQVQDLIQRHGLSWGEEKVSNLMQLLGGHPYLVRVALYQIANDRISLEKLMEVAPTEEGIYCDHLRRLLQNLQEKEELLAAFKRVVSANGAVDVGTEAGFKLRSMGLVKFQGNKVMVLCELYQKYFSDRLFSPYQK